MRRRILRARSPGRPPRGARKPRGGKAGKDSLPAAPDPLREAYLLFTVPIDSRSEAVRTSNPKKAYPIDPALAAAHSFSAAKNTGHLLETIVYLELRRRGYACAYVRTREGHEVDFLPRRPDREQLVPVCADPPDPETRRRGLRSVESALAEYGHEEALLVTLDTTDTVTVPGGTIRVLPAWRWLLEA